MNKFAGRGRWRKKNNKNKQKLNKGPTTGANKIYKKRQKTIESHMAVNASAAEEQWY